MPDRRETARLASAKAAELWAAFTPSEQHGVRFGMFPAGPMDAAEKAGVDGHALAVALMDLASQNGGMRG